MTLSLVLFLTLRFRRQPSTHALFSRVVVVVGVAVFAAVALFGVAVLARIHEHQLAGASSTEQSEAAAAAAVAAILPRREPIVPHIDHIHFLSDSDTTSDSDSIFEADWSSDADDQTP